MSVRVRYTQSGSFGDNAVNHKFRNGARWGRFVAWALFPMLLATSGCSEARVPVYPVSGKVSFQGKPPVGARVVLHPINGGAEDVAPSGRVNEDGTFAITVYEPGDGAPAGDYVATIQWFKVVTDSAGGSAAGPNVLPKKYASATTSPIKVNVQGASTEIEPITIANK